MYYEWLIKYFLVCVLFEVFIGYGGCWVVDRMGLVWGILGKFCRGGDIYVEI